MNGRVCGLVALLGAMTMGLIGCEEEGEPCTSTLDCEVGVCGPSARCQSGEVGDPCDEGSHCLGTCGPNGSCQTGLAGDPCFTDQNCEYAPGSLGTFECNSAGTCERVYRCTGSVTPCSLLSSFSCTTVTGCRVGGTCSGFAGSCFSQFSSFSCGSLDGCYWSFSSDYCSGSARSCSLYSSELSCENQGSCSWTPDCEGVAYGCSILDASECTSQPGCSLE